MPEVTVRPATAEDRDPVLDLARAALGWAGDDRDRRYFAWKHDDNPFGPSPAWVAESDGALIGFRTFLRWELVEPGGRVLRAVRAVDTATHPEHQGKGIFTRLTQAGLDQLRADGVDVVFNTPNDNSRPGYLKMGWRVVGRPPLLVRVRSAGALVRLASARAAADKWSQASGVGGEAASDVLADPKLDDLFAAQPPPIGLRTRRDPAYLRWRYGFGDLHYRAVTGARGVDDGVAVYRVRRRGSAAEVTVCELLVPGGNRRLEAALLRRVAAQRAGDYLLRVGRARDRRGLEVPLPRQGPILASRAVITEPPPLAGWSLSLGDLELF